ncbi:MAG: DNA replication and repair protein RecF [Pseudarcicella sp.]|nr:DNA replication and repair protein RecF [Pseudarcicella sp.]
MHLQNICLTNFKSYESEDFQFCKGVNCIVGENGIGKTNLLDAIYFLSLTKSATSSQDVLSISHQADFMMIEGVFEINLNKQLKTETITVALQKGQKKAVLHDKKLYEKMADHVGKFPVVMLSPNDTDIARDGSEERRKFFDGVIAQFDSEYLDKLLLYNRLLLQRNSLLKQFYERNYVDHDLLDVYSTPLVECAIQLFEVRKTFIENFIPLFQKHYYNLSENREKVTVLYESSLLLGNFENIFRQNRQKDIAAQRTTKGIHKDDFIFEIDDFPLKKFGSQGQQKSFVIALKLAQYEILTQKKSLKPILLLDDIFDKLDDRRIQKLIEMMTAGIFGQIFITDARPERTHELLNNKGFEMKYFKLKK